MKTFFAVLLFAPFTVLWAAPSGSSPNALSSGNWLTVGGDTGHTKYSTLKQINTENVANLKIAWTYDLGAGEVTPVVVDGVMYYPAGNRIIALVADTGAEVWKTDMSTLVPSTPQEEVNAARGEGLAVRGAPGGNAPRTGGPAGAAGSSVAPAQQFLRLGSSAKYGVAYWRGSAKTGARIVVATSGGYMLELDAKTGNLCKEFAKDGVLDLRLNAMEKMPYTDYTPGALPTIYKNLAIITPRTGEQGRYGPPGDPRAFDLETGKEVWRFHVVPRPGEENFGSWGLNGWQDRRGPGSWVPLTVDYSTGTIFLATGNATDQDYGYARPGDNLYATCVVALDGDTGKLKWYFQTTHHDIYDWDSNSPPVLADVTTAEGKKVPAVIQNTKQGYLFVLDRATGKPLLPVEERQVPASDAPGESTSATEPVPVKPGPIARVSLSREEVANLSPESHKFCLDIYDKVLQAGEGTPYSMVPTLVFPSSTGGGTFAGATYDPNLNLIFVNDKDLGTIAMLTPQLSSRKFESLAKSKIPFEDPNGYPCSAPPWGELMAINAATGDIVWREPLGEIKALTAKGIPKTGTDNGGGSVATAGGVLFIGASQDRTFRALDSKTGKELWSIELKGNAGATPLTFLGKNGKQYVSVVTAGRIGAGAGQLVTFSLP
jgi:quinoprotein glucose dehydrogenase